jgi:hypothetical protein
LVLFSGALDWLVEPSLGESFFFDFPDYKDNVRSE